MGIFLKMKNFFNQFRILAVDCSTHSCPIIFFNNGLRRFQQGKPHPVEGRAIPKNGGKFESNNFLAFYYNFFEGKEYLKNYFHNIFHESRQ